MHFILYFLFLIPTNFAFAKRYFPQILPNLSYHSTCYSQCLVLHLVTLLHIIDQSFIDLQNLEWLEVFQSFCYTLRFVLYRVLFHGWTFLILFNTAPTNLLHLDTTSLILHLYYVLPLAQALLTNVNDLQRVESQESLTVIASVTQKNLMIMPIIYFH